MKKQIIEQINKIREIMGLQEVMQSKIDEWKVNTVRIGNSYSIIVGIDDETNYNLFLFVGFTKEKADQNFEDFDYSFIVVDPEGQKITDFMNNREQVSAWIPEAIRGKRQLFPIIEELTKKILETYQPEEVHRKTVEQLSNKEVARYHQITRIFENYGYHTILEEIDGWGYHIWIMRKDNLIERKTIEENTIHPEYISENRKKQMDAAIQEYIKIMKKRGVIKSKNKD